jgi:serine/threonine protein kinase
LTPQKFQRFEIVRKLPAGGMGRVYEAIDANNGRRVALKLIDRGTDPDSVAIVAAERLGVELQEQLCALDPRVTTVYEFGETPEFLYIVMEYVDGKDLSELAAEDRLGYPFSARIAQDVLEVLAHAHNFRAVIDGREYRGIVHGDIKPRNIRLTSVGQTRVLDFGIAKALSMTRSFTQNMFGSVQYSSPERLKTGEVTISSDLWAVGVVLYELIARKPYFQAETSPKLERMIRGYSELKPVPEETPQPLRQILSRALSPDPDFRYQTATEFAADLRAYRNDQPLVSMLDSEATRRTSRSAVDGDTDATVRTTIAAVETEDTATMRIAGGAATPPPVTPAPPKLASSTPASKPASKPPKSGVRWGRIFLLVFLGVCLFAAYLFVHEWLVWRDARGLAHDLESERVQKLDTAWDQYQELARRSNLGMSIWGVQSAMHDRLMSDADRVINEYRSNDAPTVTEAEWLRARQAAARALELMPRDKTIRGKLRVIDGHIARIRGTARRDGKMLQDARERFTEAADLMPKSPDPWLGLERLYVYSLRDVDKAEDSVKEAEKRGQEIGKKETALLADGYRDRAERTFKEALTAQSQVEQKRYLDLARKDFDHARQLYESIIPWGGAAANLRKAYDGLDRIDVLTREEKH